MRAVGQKGCLPTLLSVFPAAIGPIARVYRLPITDTVDGQITALGLCRQHGTVIGIACAWKISQAQERDDNGYLPAGRVLHRHHRHR